MTLVELSGGANHNEFPLVAIMAVIGILIPSQIAAVVCWFLSRRWLSPMGDA